MKVSSQIKIRFVVVDTITGNEVTDLTRFESEANEQIANIERNDKEAGCYVVNSYRVDKIEII